jgi:putative transposase
MPNHFHILLVSSIENGITKFMLHLSTSYAKYFNIKYELVGRIFQERYRAKPIETDEYLLHLSRYIHLNIISSDLKTLTDLYTTPGVKASLVQNQLLQYPWSSYGEYIHTKKGICSTELILSYFSKTYTQLSYKNFVEASIPVDATGILSPFI